MKLNVYDMVRDARTGKQGTVIAIEGDTAIIEPLQTARFSGLGPTNTEDKNWKAAVADLQLI